MTITILTLLRYLSSLLFGVIAGHQFFRSGHGYGIRSIYNIVDAHNGQVLVAENGFLQCRL